MEELTIGELREKMDTGELSARVIVESYLERVERIDPSLRSVIEVNPDALSIAEEHFRAEQILDNLIQSCH